QARGLSCRTTRSNGTTGIRPVTASSSSGWADRSIATYRRAAFEHRLRAFKPSAGAGQPVTANYQRASGAHIDASAVDAPANRSDVPRTNSRHAAGTGAGRIVEPSRELEPEFSPKRRYGLEPKQGELGPQP